MSDTNTPPQLEIKCHAETLRLVYPFTSREQTRYYLNGVCFQQHPVKGVIAVATCGHRLAAMYDPDGIMHGAQEAILAVKPHMAAALKDRNADAFYHKGEMSHVIGRGKDGEKVSHTKIGRNHLYVGYNAAIEGTFPDWRRVVPKTPGKVLGIAYNHAYMRGFTEVLGKKAAIQLFFNGDEASPTVIRCSEYKNWFGVLMPMRAMDTAAGPLPQWFSEDQ